MADLALRPHYERNLPCLTAANDPACRRQGYLTLSLREKVCLTLSSALFRFSVWSTNVIKISNLKSATGLSDADSRAGIFPL